MDLTKLRVPDLVLICDELGIGLGEAKRKPHIWEIIRGAEIPDEEIRETWELIQEREKRALEREKELEREQENREGRKAPSRKEVRDAAFQKSSPKEGEGASAKVGKNNCHTKNANTRVFRTKRLFVCYSCGKPGHMAASCKKKVVFSYLIRAGKTGDRLSHTLKN